MASSRKKTARKPSARTSQARRPSKQVSSRKEARPKASSKRTARENIETPKVVARSARPAKPSATNNKPQPAALAARPRATGVATRNSGLNAKDLESFRDQLLEKRAEILGNVRAMRDEATGGGSGDRSELSSMPLHMADLGTDNFERELTLGLLEGERSLLRDIDQALDRIRDGTYGLCLATGKPIGKARLKAQPWAKYCMEYMLQQESGRRFRY